MSYCRWSSDSFRCDLYCYESVHGGFVTHVAGRKKIGLDALGQNPGERILETDFNDRAQADAYMNAYNDWHARYEALPFKEIGLPHDGETFTSETLADMLDVVLMLKGKGYNVPDWLETSIREEIAEEAA